MSGGQSQIVFGTKDARKVTGAAPEAGIKTAVAALKDVLQVAAVTDPFQANAVSSDGQVARGSVQYTAQPAQVKSSTLDAIKAAVVPEQDAACGFHTTAASTRLANPAVPDYRYWSAC